MPDFECYLRESQRHKIRSQKLGAVLRVEWGSLMIKFCPGEKSVLKILLFTLLFGGEKLATEDTSISNLN